MASIKNVCEAAAGFQRRDVRPKRSCVVEKIGHEKTCDLREENPAK